MLVLPLLFLTFFLLCNSLKLLFFKKIFGIILTLGIRAMTEKLTNGMLAGNLAITAVLLLGVVGTSKFLNLSHILSLELNVALFMY